MVYLILTVVSAVFFSGSCGEGTVAVWADRNLQHLYQLRKKLMAAESVIVENPIQK